MKEEYHDFKRTVGIIYDLKIIYTRLKENELLDSDTLSSRPRLCTDTSFQNLSRYRNVSANLGRDIYEILNNLEEMLKGSKESESVLPEFKKNSEVMRTFLFGYHFQLKSPNVDSYKDQRKINEPELRSDFN